MARVTVKFAAGGTRTGDMSDTAYAHLMSAMRGEISQPHRSEGYTIDVGNRRVQFAPSDVSYVKREG